MIDFGQLTDQAVMERLGQRLSRARLDRNLTQADLATEAGVHKNTIFRLEAGGSTQLKNLVRVLRVLGLLDRLEAVIPEPVPSPLRELQARSRQRRRAVSRPDREAGGTGKTAGDWTWGDEEPGSGDEAGGAAGGET